jgi:hypothetical protein
MHVMTFRGAKVIGGRGRVQDPAPAPDRDRS